MPISPLRRRPWQRKFRHRAINAERGQKAPAIIPPLLEKERQGRKPRGGSGDEVRPKGGCPQDPQTGRSRPGKCERRVFLGEIHAQTTCRAKWEKPIPVRPAYWGAATACSRHGALDGRRQRAGSGADGKRPRRPFRLRSPRLTTARPDGCSLCPPVHTGADDGVLLVSAASDTHPGDGRIDAQIRKRAAEAAAHAASLVREPQPPAPGIQGYRSENEPAGRLPMGQRRQRVLELRERYAHVYP